MGKQMQETDPDELEILDAHEKGQLESVATKAELAKFPPSRACLGRNGMTCILPFVT